MNNEWIEVSGKTVDDAITEGLIKLGTTTEKMEVEVLEKESSGLFGIFGRHEARVRVRLKEVKAVEKISKPAKMKTVNESAPFKPLVEKKEVEKMEKEKPIFEEVKKDPASPETVAKAESKTKEFLGDVFKAMNLNTEIDFSFNRDENELTVDVKSDDMGILIGKRGQTLDSLQYLLSLVINKECEEYVKIKLDSENYRIRRKETLENLARNISSKVKRIGRQVSLEPMNSFERRIIHSALQSDDEVETFSEGNDPYRRVVVKLKGERRNYNKYGKGGYGGRKPYSKKSYAKSGGYRGYNKYKKFDKEEGFASSTSEEE